MWDFSGRRVVITGAARGIGLAYARAFVEANAHVAIADILTDELAAAEAALHAVGGPGEIMALRADVTSETDVATMIKAVEDRWSGVDILVNNAGLYGGMKRSPVETMDLDEWDRMLITHLRGIFLVSRATIPLMRERGYGKIINISSTIVPKPEPGMAHYAAAKSGVVGITRALALETGAYGIRVNALAPGLVGTEAARSVMPAARHEEVVARRALKIPLQPKDVVGPLLFLASPASDAITGQMLVVDGGLIFH